MGPARLAALLLIVLHLSALFAGFVAPYDPEEQHRSLSFSPPAMWRVSGGGIAAQTGANWHSVRLFAKGHLFAVEGTEPLFVIGSDEYGRDQLSRFVYGGRISLFAGLLASLLSLGIGAAAGLTAGYFGGWRDALLMRLVELSLSLPWLYLLLTARALLPLSMGPRQTLLLLSAVIGVVGWARPARLIRGVVSSLRERAYVGEARSFGASHWYLVRRHMLPELAALLVTQLAVLVPQNVLAEVALSFVGLGVAEPAASWGGLIGYLRQLPVLACCAWMALPCGFLVVVFASYQKLADIAILRTHGQWPKGR